MKETISITIAGAEYTLRGAEDAEYTQKVAAHVDTKITEVLRSGNISLVEAAILAGMNIGDEYYKVLETAEQLRGQLKNNLEDMNRMKAEITSLQREIERLRAQR